MSIFNKILITNRGEIALRVIRSIKQLGIRCCVVYAENEKNAWFVSEADEAYSLGDGALKDTYLNIEKIITIAKQNAIDAIHPGYGFLSENAEFAKACIQNGIAFIGPSPESIALMGNKIEALRFISSIGIPYLQSVFADSTDELLKSAKDLTFPVIIKAAAGGGGKGMRIVYSSENLKESIEAASREAFSYFGNSAVFIEKYIELPRHIEVQILGDTHGNIVHLFERECTIQRRHQKIIEEAPSATLSDKERESLLNTAVKIAQAMHYVSAGTLEFLLDENHHFYFLEMNTRIQVEHPVTEEITGVDIVSEQIRIAQGQSLSFGQSDINIRGHALECRVYAENAFKGFSPSAGNVLIYSQPLDNTIRVDSSINGPSEILSDYDPMITKVTVHAPSRNECIQKMSRYLDAFVIQGIDTNLDYLKEVLHHINFEQNEISTNFCSAEKEILLASYESKVNLLSKERLMGWLLVYLHTVDINEIANKQNVWSELGFWRNRMEETFTLDGENFVVRFTKPQPNVFKYSVNGANELTIFGYRNGFKLFARTDLNNAEAYISSNEETIYFTFGGITRGIIHRNAIPLKNNPLKTIDSNLGNYVFAPINGKVCKVYVKPNDKVNKGDIIMVIESMKMENNILAPREGLIEQIMVNAGDRVSGKEIVASLI